MAIEWSVGSLSVLAEVPGVEWSVGSLVVAADANFVPPPTATGGNFIPFLTWGGL